MPNYLKENDWKSELKKKENKHVKKTGVSDALREYEKALAADSIAMHSTLTGVIGAAREAQKSHSKNDGLCAYLGEIIKAATTEQIKLVSVPGPDDPDVARKALARRITAAKNVTDMDRAFYFVCAPGKTTGLQVLNKQITAAHVQEVKEQRGKGVGGPVFRGLAYGDSGKVVFDLGEVKPVAGIAKALGKTLRGHCQLMYKVIVRGGGISMEEDQDVDEDFESPFEKATGLPDFKAPGREPVPETIEYVSTEEWAKLIDKMKKLEPGQRQGMRDGILGLAKRDAQNLKADTTVPPELKKARALVIQNAITAAKKLADAKAPAPTPATAPQNASTLERRGEVHQVMGKNVEFIEKAVFVKGSTAAMASRKELAAGGKFEPVRQALAACETGKNATNFQAVRQACDALDAELDRLKQLQQEGLPPGTAQAALGRTDLNLNKSFKDCAKILAACEKDPTPRKQEVLRKACEIYLKQWSKDRPKATGPMASAMDESAKVVREWRDRVFAQQNGPAIDAQAKASLEARTQARLAEIAAQYKTLGDPANWTREQEETASELEAAYLFEEGTVASGANFGAAPLGGEGGVNAAFWVKRKAPVRKDAKDSAERLFIFKPGDAEADVASGLPAGSGAAREVFAKDLADFLGGSGLKVDVCPTNLVNIEGRKLPESNGQPATNAPRLGAMQRLGADVKGGIVENLRKDNKLAGRVDKAEYDHLAVYDLIIGNLDRHGGNILLSGDLATKPKLVPIDHGTSMPGPQTLKLNRHRILHPQNIMMSPEMPQADGPLSDSAKAALKSIKPADMAKALRDSQGRLQTRHAQVGQPGMGLDDDQIKLMTRSTQFMQAAADKLTVREMYEAKARFVDEMMADPEPKWDQLVDGIAIKLRQWQKDLATTNMLISTDASPGQFRISALQELGWCMGMSPDSAKQWVIDNAGQAQKILAGRIENPRLKEEAEALRKDLGGAPTVEADPKTKPYKDQIIALQSLIGQATDSGDLPDMPALRRTYSQLGGDQVLAELLSFCSSDKQKTEEEDAQAARATDPQDKAQLEENALRGKVERMRAWKRFVDAGGIPALASLGGSQFPSANDGYSELISLRVQKLAAADLDKIPAEDVAKRQAAEIDKTAKAAQAIIDKMRAPKTKQAQQKQWDALLDMQKKGDPTGAQGQLQKFVVDLDRLLGTEDVTLKLHRNEVTVMKNQVASANPGQIAASLTNTLDALDRLTDPEVLDDPALTDQRTELGFRLEHAVLGGQSKAGKFDQRLKAANGAVAPFQGAAFHGALAARSTDLDRRLKAFDLGSTYDNDLTSLERACDYAKRTTALRGKITSTPNHANVTAAGNRLGQVDQLFGKLDATSFNETTSKINEPLQAAERLMR